jgi:hypothetical protein
MPHEGSQLSSQSHPAGRLFFSSPLCQVWSSDHRSAQVCSPTITSMMISGDDERERSAASAAALLVRPGVTILRRARCDRAELENGPGQRAGASLEIAGLAAVSLAWPPSSVSRTRSSQGALIPVVIRSFLTPLFTHRSASMIEDGGVEKPGFHGPWRAMLERGLGSRNPFLSADALGFTSSHSANRPWEGVPL